jgi:hypothetical protein
MPTIGEQIAWAVHQGSPSGADANSAQLIAIMQMLSKAGEHTRDIAQWWEQRPQRKVAREEALRALLFQDAASGKVPIDSLDMEGRVKLRALRKVDKPYTSQGLNDALNSIKIPGGRLSSNDAAKTDIGMATTHADMVDSTVSNWLIGPKDTESTKEIGPKVEKMMERFVSDNPAEAASLYIKALKSYGSDPASLQNMSEAQQAMISVSSRKGPGSAAIFDKLNGLLYKQTTEANVKKFEAGPMLTAATMLPDGKTPDTRTQAAIITHLTANQKGGALANKLGLYDKVFPYEKRTDRYFNPFTQTFASSGEISAKLDSDPRFRGWAIEGMLRKEKQQLPEFMGQYPSDNDKGYISRYKTSTGKVISAEGNSKVKSGMVAPYSESDYEANQVPKYTEEEYEQNQLRNAVRDQINSVSSGDDQDLARFQAQMANKAPGTPTLGSNLSSYLQSSGGIESDPKNIIKALARMTPLEKYPGPNPIEGYPGWLPDESSSRIPNLTDVGSEDSEFGRNLSSLSQKEQRALLELLMKLQSGVGAQQSPAIDQYPGMGYGLRVR